MFPEQTTVVPFGEILPFAPTDAVILYGESIVTVCVEVAEQPLLVPVTVYVPVAVGVNATPSVTPPVHE